MAVKRRAQAAPVVGALMPKISETAFKDAIVELARFSGWLVMHPLPAQLSNGRWVTAVQGDVGWPDLALCHRRRGLFILAELKVGTNKPVPAQTAWLDALRDCGVRAELWRPTEWVNYIAPLLIGEDQMADQHYTYTPGTLEHLLHEHLPTLCPLDIDRLAVAVASFDGAETGGRAARAHQRGFSEGWAAGHADAMARATGGEAPTPPGGPL